MRRGGQVLRTYNSVGDLLTSADMYAPVQAIALLPRPHLGGQMEQESGPPPGDFPVRPGAHTITTLQN